MRNLKYIFSFVSFGIFLAALLPQFAFASTVSLSGWAWSSNIGWISFSSTNTNTGALYGVTEDTTTGLLSGYAWSSNIGWIQFGNLSGFPTGTGTSAVNATVSGNNIIGWAQAVAGAGRTDGWDGWISLSGTAAGGYGVNTSGTNSYAWGGPVVGWISFNPNFSGASPTPVANQEGCTNGSNSVTCGVPFVAVTPPQTPGFTLGCSQDMTIPVNTSGPSSPSTLTVNINTTGNFNSYPVALTSISSNLPGAPTLMPSSSSIPNSTGLSNFTLSLSQSATTAGNYQVNLQGTGQDGTTGSGICNLDITSSNTPSTPGNPSYHEF
ncbi:MAG TPA: hypothetical protein VMR73_00950 [Candidatus Paceibacterota bacterium]|nr:hypothetical protein [Candidatus Paceibacterota bacterium]